MNRESAKSTKEELRREDDAFDAFFEDGDVEVDQKTEGMFGHFQVGDYLGFIDGRKFFDSFQFHNQNITNKKI